MKPRVIQYSEINRETWDDFVNNNSMGYAYHLYDVIALDRWENDKNISFCIWDDDRNEMVFLIQLHIEHKDLDGGFNRLHSRWGFILKDGLTTKEKRKVKDVFMEYIDGFFRESDVRRYDMGIAPLSAYMSPENHIMVNPAIHLGFSPLVRYTYILDINKSDEELISSCEQTTRQAIRKVREEVRSGKYEVVEALSNRTDYEAYVKLHRETYTRTGAAGAIIYDQY